MAFHKKYNKYVKAFIIAALLAWFVLFLADKIDLTTSDLGRHITNGRLTVNQGIIQSTNFYSYTQPEFRMINHHWGSGVIFYAIDELFGFSGLSIFYILASASAFLIFFWLAQKEAGFKLAAIVAFFVLPLIAYRSEIRPEVFTYLFCAIFFAVLWQYRKGRLSPKWLFALPALQIFWVNLHIYFVLGIGILGAFFAEQLIKRGAKEIKTLGKILVLVVLASLVSPFFIESLIYPFTILKEYGYSIVENQAIWYLEKIKFPLPMIKPFKVVFIAYVLSIIALVAARRRKFSMPVFFIATTFGIMGWLAVRNFSLFGYFALFAIAFNLKNAWPKKIKLNELTKYVLFCAGMLIIFIGYRNFAVLRFKRAGIGVYKENPNTARFFKEAGIKGPLFNNYDIGSYLIYYLYPDEPVYVDNRPEAYTVGFFKERYIPMQVKKDKWKEELEKYKFNTIIFGHRDATQWGKFFLRTIIDDPAWAPVYFDGFAIILVRRTFDNQPIINKYGMPRSLFDSIISRWQ